MPKALFRNCNQFEQTSVKRSISNLKLVIHSAISSQKKELADTMDTSLENNSVTLYKVIEDTS